MADIAELSIQIDASAEKASKEIDKLIRRLDKLHTKLAGLDVSSLTSQLQSLANVDLSNLDKLTGVKIPGVSGGSGGRGGGGGSTIHLSSGIKKLGSVMNASKNAIAGTSKGIADLAKNMTTAKVSVGQLTNTFMNLYFRLFMIRRLFSGLGKAITSSMDMIETYHYFDVAIGKIGNAAKKNFAQYGYDSAEAYADSFRKRSLDLTEKMTGYVFDSEGNYKTNGQKSLGMDPDLVLQYQAQYGQIADSIGMTGEAALATSKALTMLAADWSSLRNIEFDTAFEKMASGLAGQSRAVRALGIDITQASLQQTAYNLGITTSISKMDQAAKAELRMITILDQSRVAWGDLAKTMETPANQLRLIKQNLFSLAKAIGNVFMPLVQKVLPYVNALIIAIRKLFQWVGGLIGVKVSDASSGIGGMDDAFIDFGEDGTEALGNIEDATEDAKKKMEELKRSVLGFDELNILTAEKEKKKEEEEDKGAGSKGITPSEQGILDASLLDMLDEYEKIWNEAFSRMENHANQIADKITGVFGTIYNYIKNKDWNGLGAYVAKGINQGLDWIYEKLKAISPKITGFVDAVTKTLNGLVDNVNWKRIGEILATGLNSLMDVLNTWYSGFDFDNFGKKLADAFNGFKDTVDWKELGKTLGNKIKSIIDTAFGFISGVNWKDFGKKLADAFNSLQDTVDWEKLGKTLGGSIQAVIDTALGFVKNVKWDNLGKNIAKALNGVMKSLDLKSVAELFTTTFNGIFTALDNFNQTFDWHKLKNDITEFFNTAIANIDLANAGRVLNQTITELLNSFWYVAKNTKWDDLGEKIGKFIKEIEWKKHFKTAFDSITTILKEFVTGLFGEVFGDFGEGFASGFIDGIKETVEVAVEVISGLAKALNDLFEAIEQFVPGTGETLGKILGWFVGFKMIGGAAGKIGGLVKTLFGGGAAAAGGGASGGGAGGTVLGGLAKTALNLVKSHPIITGLGLSIANAATIGEDNDMFGGLDLIDGMAVAIDNLGKSAKNQQPDIKKAFDCIVEFLDNTGRSDTFAISSIAQTLHDAGISAGEFYEAAGGPKMSSAMQAVWSALQDLDTKSLTVSGSIGYLASNMGRYTTQIKDNVAQTVSDVAKTIAESFPQLQSEVSEGTTSIYNTITGMTSGVSSNVSGTTNDAETLFANMHSSIAATVKNMKDNTVTTMTGMGGTVGTVITGMKQNIATIFGGMAEDTKQKSDSVKERVSGGWSTMKQNMIDRINEAKTGIATSLGLISSNTETETGKISGTVYGMTSGISTNVSDTTKNAETLFANMYDSVKVTVHNMDTDTVATMTGMGGTVGTVITGMKQNIATIFGGMASDTKQKADSVRDHVSGGWATMKQNLISRTSEARTALSTAFSGMSSETKTNTDTTTSHISDKWYKLKASLEASVKGATTALTIGINGINNKAKLTFDPAIESGIKLETELGVNLVNTARNAASSIPNSFSGISNNIAGHFGGTYNAIYNAMGVNSMYSLGSSITNNLQNGISSRRLSLPHVGWNWQRLTYGPADNRQWFEVPQLYVKWYAKGGIPNAGELFWMNENNNPELMYKKGGRTHIDSNTEIVNSLKEAFTDSLMDVAMSMSSQSNNGQAPVIEYTFKVDSETMFKTVQKGAKKMSGRGYKFESAF